MLRKKTATCTVDIGVFSTFSKAKLYLSSITTFKNDYTIEEIIIDPEPVLENNIYPFQIIINKHGKIVNVHGSSIHTVYEKPYGRFKVGSRSHGPNWYINIFAENKEQASVKALEIREDLILVGLWPK